MMRFENRLVLVTGSTGGLGVEICRRLAEEGGRLVVTDLSQDACDDVVASLPRPDEHLALTLDVTSEEQWRAVVARVEARGDGLQALVNNAGIGSLATVEDETSERWDRVIAVDQTGRSGSA